MVSRFVCRHALQNPMKNIPSAHDALMPAPAFAHKPPVNSSEAGLALRASPQLETQPGHDTPAGRQPEPSTWQAAQVVPEDALRYKLELENTESDLLLARKQTLDSKAQTQQLQTELTRTRALQITSPVGLGVMAAVGLCAWLYQRRRINQLRQDLRELHNQMDSTGSTLPSMLSEDVPGEAR
jgi:hypothetical protein